eukprot:8173401-Pyramimonas_sp.AAC.1
MGELRPEILAAHEAKLANPPMQLARQRRNQKREQRRMMNRAGTPAAPTPAGQPAINVAAVAAVGALPAAQQMTPAAPPIQNGIG